MLRSVNVSLTPYLSASVFAAAGFVSTTPRTSNRGFPRKIEQRIRPILPLPSTKTRAFGGTIPLETNVREAEKTLDFCRLDKGSGAAKEKRLPKGLDKNDPEHTPGFGEVAGRIEKILGRFMSIGQSLYMQKTE